MTRFLLSVSLAAATAACGSGAAETPHARPAAEPNGTVVIAAETLATTIPVAGDVRPVARAELATRLMARVTAVPVDLGTRVAAGAVLVRLGVEDIAANRRRAEAGLRLAEAARAEAARHAARMDTLYAQDAVARIQRDQAALNLTRAETELAMARVALSEVETAAEYAEIRAPFDGVVVARSVDPGDLAAPGVPLVTLERAGLRDAVLHIPADAAARLAPGDTIAVTGPDGRRARVPVRAVAGGADPLSRTVEIKAVLPADWPTGIALTGHVPGGTRVGVAIPADAVVRRGQLTGVRVVSGERTVLRWIRLGRTLEDGRIEVLSGLAPGDRVVR